MLGMTFGRLTVLNLDGRIAECVCACGSQFSGNKYSIKSGNTSSCGCLHRERSRDANLKHGYAVGPKRGLKRSEYKIWGEMIRRCHVAESSSYYLYGAKGTAVCDRWRFGDGTLGGFECFIGDMGDKPSPRHSIDRIENDGGYELSNCRWATPKEQARNQRKTLIVEFRGERMPFRSACELAGLPAAAVIQRIDTLGWTADRALSEPIGSYMHKVEADGQDLSLRQAAKRAGLSEFLVYARVKRYGWTVERALSTPARPIRRAP